jgi:hypothetical protein
MSRSSLQGISDDLLLAALDRAVRHRSGQPATTWHVLEHLHLQSEYEERVIRGRLWQLVRDGLVASSRLGRKKAWSLTAAGKQRLQAVGEKVIKDLPESPQHQEWCAARDTGAGEIEAVRGKLRDALTQAMIALEDPETNSDVWFALKHDLERGARLMAATTYMLREWREPDDAQADVDDLSSPGDELYDDDERKRRRHRRRGRRNPFLWMNPDVGPPDTN